MVDGGDMLYVTLAMRKNNTPTYMVQYAGTPRRVVSPSNRDNVRYPREHRLSVLRQSAARLLVSLFGEIIEDAREIIGSV